MARPTRDEIETYMSITGASESLALQKFEEHGGNLNEAVNAHFGGAEIHVAHPPPAPIPQHSFTNNNESQFGRGLFPILSAARSFRPSLLLDPNYRRDLFNRIGAAAITGPASLHSPPGAVMGLPVEPNSRHEQLHHSTVRSNVGDDHNSTEYSASHLDNNVEDAMIQAAIMASKREAEASSSSGLSERTLQEDDDFARAVLLSLKTAEQEKVAREQHMEGEIQEFGNNRRSKQGSSLNSNGAHNVIEEQQLRQNPIHSAGNHHQHGEEWGGISSKELDEALMLETALFSEISEGTSNRSLIATQLQSGLEKRTIPDLQPTPHPSLQPLPASRLLKEQQDMEYLASLFHDKEKEEESHKKMLNELECERRLAAKKASLAWEPASDDENAVTLLVRMPNGSRLGRRFLKSDKLKLLFDFIDINGAVEPGSYRVVRSYPRRAFTVDDGLLTLSKLDLTNKQEALFLELI
ncbi:plant UBX domain-containing protein 9 isoform X1 [Morus notabilis]|uniref:plant UBX domain-containing protein 9 isoform X1 n=1 Tax=Morus notabilis TaxID=981085 RepID=UPI000CED7020|nr:plant UBX domain-containing protein 9 isoform X1 [Morus notabilis]